MLLSPWKLFPFCPRQYRHIPFAGCRVVNLSVSELEILNRKAGQWIIYTIHRSLSVIDFEVKLCCRFIAHCASRPDGSVASSDSARQWDQ